MKISLIYTILRFTILSLLMGITVPAMAAFDADRLSSFTENFMDLWSVDGFPVLSEL